MGSPSACLICGREPFLGGAFVPCECLLAGRLAEIEAEEAAGERRLLIAEHRFTNPEFEAYYSEFDGPACLAVQPWLPDEVKRARELEARGYYLWTARLLKGHTGPYIGKMAENRVFMYRAERPEDVPRHTVRAIRSVIEELEPGWVEAVAEARRYADDPQVMAAWCGLPLQAVMAVLDVLSRRRGVL